MTRLSLSITTALGLLSATTVSLHAANLRAAGIFADGMVVQRGVEVPVWGRGSPGAEVAVEFAAQKRSVTVAGDGTWSVNLAPLKASVNGAELKISSGGEVVAFKDVLVGEVWLCSGQSNMQRNLSESDTGLAAVAGSDFPAIRYVIIAHDRSPARLDDLRKPPAVTWRPVNKTNTSVSAVAFFFARKLQQTLGVPVGLIISAWEGSSITTWIPKDRLLPSSENNQGETFNAKISPLEPFAIKGVVWYQGEENHGMGMKYSDYLTSMAEAWRKEWGGDLPFLIVMIAPHTYEGVPDQFPGEKGKVPEFWMAQLDAARRLKNAEVACTVDVGNARNDIHPRQKEPVGERLAMAAVKLCYGASNSAPGPLFKAVDFKGNTATVTFDNVARGLILRGDPSGFEVAGANKKYAPVMAALLGKESVVLRSNTVAQPAFVRYAWSNTPDWSVFNSEGLPAIPFSTEWKANHGSLADRD